MFEMSHTSYQNEVFKRTLCRIGIGLKYIAFSCNLPPRNYYRSHQRDEIHYERHDYEKRLKRNYKKKLWLLTL